MFDIPSRAALVSLTEMANAVVPSVALGFARSLDDGRVSVLYCFPHGLGEFVLPSAEVPEVFLPSTDGPRDAGAAAIDADPLRPIAWLLHFAGVQRVVSVHASRYDPGARFWVGVSDPKPLTGDQLSRFEGVAEASAPLLKTPVSSIEVSERMRRLELATELLPALLKALHAREVFECLSTAAKNALPHDLLFMTSFNNDLSKYTVIAASAQHCFSGPLLHTTYPIAVVRAMEFNIVNDHARHPLELDTFSTKLGARSSLRLPIRFSDRVIGGLVFISFEPATYTSADVPVARRLADLLAAPLLNYDLTEQLADYAQRNEGLRARSTSLELLDELLAALVDSGDSPDVFGRISAITQKILTHDASLLMVLLPDDRHARVYAISGFPSGLPDMAEVPEELLGSWEYDIFDDISLHAGSNYRQLTHMGFQSLLQVPVRLHGRFAGVLVYLSKAPAAFKHDDILVARRIADRMTVTLARDREIDASRRVDEVTARASQLEARVRALADELDARTGYRHVVGESTEWRQVLKQAAQVASAQTTVLLLGESGTGKEVVARFVHRASPHSKGPFVALNCAALPEQLLEAELFGYERGAYTGATQSKPGQLEQAAGGTLFLDEVAEMSPSAQAKFLRVLQEREFQRLGGTRVLRTDARMVAATNRDLQRAIAQGHFREDLYYRLNVFAIRLPALRDRRDDILPLSEVFLSEIGRGLGRPPGGISREARQRLMEYHWPGNVRELRNILERAAILCDGGLITTEHLALTVVAPVPTAPAMTSAVTEPVPANVPVVPTVPVSGGDLQSMERAMIEQALHSARFNKSKAAKALGLTRHQLYIRMQKYGFD